MSEHGEEGRMGLAPASVAQDGSGGRDASRHGYGERGSPDAGPRAQPCGQSSAMLGAPQASGIPPTMATA
jgi:hypothetical protein